MITAILSTIAILTISYLIFKIKKNIINIDIFNNKKNDDLNKSIKSTDATINEDGKNNMMEPLISSISGCIKKINQNRLNKKDELKELFNLVSLEDRADVVKKHIQDLQYILNEAIKYIPNSSWIYKFVEYINQSGRKQAIDYLNSKELIQLIQGNKKSVAILHIIKAYLYIANEQNVQAEQSLVDSIGIYGFFYNLFYFSSFNAQNNNFKKAIWRLDYINSKIETSTLQDAMVHSLYGDIYEKIKEQKEAIKHYKIAVNNYKKLSIDEEQYKKDILINQQKLARSYIRLKQFDLAKQVYDDFNSYIREEKNSIYDNLVVGDILNDISSFWYIQGKTAQSKDSCKEAIKFYKQQPDNNIDAKYKTYMSIKKLADIYIQEKGYENAIDNYTLALSSLKKISTNNIARYIKDILLIKTILANIYANQNRPKEAISILNKIIKQQQLIYNINKGVRAIDIAKTLSLLSKSYMKTKDFKKAAIVSTQYKNFSKQMSLDNPKDFLSLLAEAKTLLGQALMQQKKYDLAEREFTRAFILRKKLSNTNMEKNFYEIGNILTLAAYLNIDNKKLLKAEINLKLAIKYKMKLANRYIKKYSNSYLISMINLIAIMLKNDKQKSLIKILEDSMQICKQIIEQEVTSSYKNSVKVLQSLNELKQSPKAETYIKILNNRLQKSKGNKSG